MAMRPRGGGGGGGGAAPRRGGRMGGVQPVYEDFRPVSEWKQVDESHILDINLSGFTKEQIRVSTEGRNIIRIRGERLVAGNKWSRFLEDFQVPKNSEMTSIRAKFQGGVLSITVPKRAFDKPHESPLPRSQLNHDNRNKSPNEKDKDKVLQEASTSQPQVDKFPDQQKASTDPSTKHSRDDDQNKAAPQKGQDEPFPATYDAKQSTEEKSIDSRKAVDDYKREHETKGGQRGATSVTQLKNSGNYEKKEIAKSKEKDILSSEMKMEDKYKKAVKGLAELNEERQLLVNMGVAMLVVVALTAYVTYKFASGKDKN